MINNETDEPLHRYVNNETSKNEYNAVVFISHGILLYMIVLKLNDANLHLLFFLFRFLCGRLLLVGWQKQNGALAEEQEVRVFDFDEVEGYDDDE